MAMVSRTRDMLEGLVKEGSFKWLMKRKSSFDEEIEEMERSPSARENWIPELSPLANVVVRRCSKILGISLCQLRENFVMEASESLKHQSSFALNFLEYCCFIALARSAQVMSCLEDPKFRRLTFDMMVAWDITAASSQLSPHMENDASIGLKAFCRIAPAIPIIANVLVSEKIFEVLTASNSSRLHFSVYDKYLIQLERAIKKLQSQSESSLLSSLRSGRGEKILDVDGTVTTQPVLEHVGISTWPGRLTLTDHALYFEALRVVSYDKAKVYSLADDLEQVVRPELTGPWGTRLFDKAVLYNSTSLSEPVVMEFPELKGHSRRDYWLAIIREVLYAHRFISKFQITALERHEVLLKAVFGILRVQALKEISSTVLDCSSSLLMFNVCNQLPRGDLILEKYANTLITRGINKKNAVTSGNGISPTSGSALVSNLGFVFGTSSAGSSESGLVVGELSVGETTRLENAVKEAKSSYENVVLAQATVDGVKVNGLDTNLAVMKELLSPLIAFQNWLCSLLYWEDPVKSLAFCLVGTYIIFRGWMSYLFSAFIVFLALFMLLNRCCGQGKSVDELQVIAPPAMTTMEQLLAVQNAISQTEELIQDGNIIFLKCRALLVSIFPQATEKFAVALLVLALVLALVPCRYIILLAFLETFTQYSPVRRAYTERCSRRLREWWFSIPAAPVVLQKVTDYKKKKVL